MSASSCARMVPRAMVQPCQEWGDIHFMYTVYYTVIHNTEEHPTAHSHVSVVYLLCKSPQNNVLPDSGVDGVQDQELLRQFWKEMGWKIAILTPTWCAGCWGINVGAELAIYFLWRKHNPVKCLNQSIHDVICTSLEQKPYIYRIRGFVKSNSFTCGQNITWYTVSFQALGREILLQVLLVWSKRMHFSGMRKILKCIL